MAPVAGFRTYPTLFKAFVWIYVATATLALLGVVAEFAFPDRKVPFLWQLLSATVIETSVAVVYEFRQQSKLRSAPGDPRESVKRAFQLFKSVVTGGVRENAHLRLNFLLYDPKGDEFRMFVQDDLYGDNNFRITRTDGLKKGIVVCEAFEKGGLHSRNLDADAHEKYKNTAIPKDLKAIMACPVGINGSLPVGVVALDMQLPFQELGIPQPKLESMFMKLCNVVDSELDEIVAGGAA